MNISIILRKPPYGTVDASEAIRHALGAVTEDLSVRLVLVDGGVNAARKNQDVRYTPYSSIEEGIRDCINMGVEVYVDKTSLKEEYIDTDGLIDGVRIVNSHEIAEIIKTADVTMIF
ncbi:MAG: DsrE family protein [Thermodesulfovibrionales bacterium]|nr:DsrE family protein [Thermodesulfovibrionales bacterium]